MNSPLDIITSVEMQQIHKMYTEVKEKNKQAAYNLFTLSSYNNQKENFHSDVIASLLNPGGRHNEGNKFLLLFIDFLNTHYGYSLVQEDYTDAEVIKEEARIDIWIRSKVSGKSILIENKINDAGDMDDQLGRYYRHAMDNNYPVKAIIYLSPDGVKTAPLQEPEVDKLLQNVPAFSNSESDLVNGWLSKCCNINNRPESYTLIYQYIELIKQLNHTAMDKDVMKQFYELISNPEHFNIARDINELSSQLGTYRRDEFQKNWKVAPAPFKKIHRLTGYGNCGTLFENYFSKGFNYKLDVYFGPRGSAKVRLWTPDAKHDNDIGRDACFDKLESIGLKEKFVIEYPDRHNSMVAHRFRMDDYDNLIAVDHAVYNFVKDLIIRLNEIKE